VVFMTRLMSNWTRRKSQGSDDLPDLDQIKKIGGKRGRRKRYLNPQIGVIRWNAVGGIVGYQRHWGWEIDGCYKVHESFAGDCVDEDAT